MFNSCLAICDWFGTQKIYKYEENLKHIHFVLADFQENSQE